MSFFAILKRFFGRQEKGKLYPESLYRVEFNESEVVCARPDGSTESVTWSDLEEVAITTNDSGPWSCDVYWVLKSKQGGCVVPQGASGETELLRRLQTLAGFDHEAVIKAMGSTENNVFVCWRKQSLT